MNDEQQERNQNVEAEEMKHQTSENPETEPEPQS